MSRKQIILNPNDLIQRQNDLPLRLIRHIIHSHDSADNDADDVPQKRAAVDVLDAQVRPVLAVLEARTARVHDGDAVEVEPEGGGGGEVGGGDEFDEVVLGGVSGGTCGVGGVRGGVEG